MHSILVVDDEPLNRELLSRVLSKQYSIYSAESADEALKTMDSHGNEIRAILCDQLMPGISGTELAAKVKQCWPKTYFLLLTGYEDSAEITEALSCGTVHKLIVKPWRSKVLRTELESLIANE